MKIQAHKFLGFLQGLDFQTRSVLLFGPDEALLSAKADQVKQALSKNHKFDIELFTEEEIRKDPGLLESQPSLFGGGDSDKKVVLILNAKDRFMKTLEALDDVIFKDKILLFVSPGLATSSKIVKFHEANSDHYCIGIYEQTPAENSPTRSQHRTHHRRGTESDTSRA